jgi:hypothetical protein
VPWCLAGVKQIRPRRVGTWAPPSRRTKIAASAVD